MTFGFGGRRKYNGGWTVISGKRGFREIVREIRVALIVFAAVLLSASLFLYLYFAGPWAVSRQGDAGLAAIQAGDYPGAIAALESAVRHSPSPDAGLMEPLARSYFAAGRYADAARMFEELITLHGGARTGVTPAGGDGIAARLTAPIEAGSADASGDGVLAYHRAAGIEPLPAAYYLLAESYAYQGDLPAALGAAADGYGATGADTLRQLSRALDLAPPVSLTASGEYNGRFVFHYVDAPAGVRTFYTADGTPASPGADGAHEYRDGIEAGIGAHEFRAVNVNRYGYVSQESAYQFTVLDAPGNLNGNIVNGAFVVARGGQTFYFNGSGIYRSGASQPPVKLAEGERISGLNLLGEWLYFIRTGGPDAGIYRIKVDGTGIAKLSGDAARCLQAADDTLYYVTRNGLYAMLPDGGGRSQIAEGAIHCLNYENGTLYFIMEETVGGADGAGPVYGYDVARAGLTKLIDETATFLQLDGGRLYYAPATGGGSASVSADIFLRIATPDGEPAGVVARPDDEGAADAASVLVDLGGVYYGRPDGSVAVAGMYGARTPSRVYEVLPSSGAARTLNIADGAIYALTADAAGGAFGCVRINGAAGVTGSAAKGEDLSTQGGGEGLLSFGEALYMVVSDADGEQSIYTVVASGPDAAGDGAPHVVAAAGTVTPGEPILSGIPAGERVVYAGERFVLTSDYATARLYRLPEEPSAAGALVSGSSKAAAAQAAAVAQAGDGQAVQADGNEPATQSGDAARSTPTDGSTQATSPGAGITAPALGTDGDAAPGDSGDAVDPAGGDGGAAGETAIPGVVSPQKLADSSTRLWSGISALVPYGGELYFTSQAGFFKADGNFERATFIRGDGPQSGEPFIVARDRVFFKKDRTTGEGGLYCMGLDGSGMTRLYDGEVSGFDFDGQALYYSVTDTGELYALAPAGEEWARPVLVPGDDGGMTCDAVICGAEGGVIVRRTDAAHGLYALDPVSGVSARLTEGGAGEPLYCGGDVYYRAWDAGEAYRRLESP